MENQHRKIEGYRELSQDEIDLMNEIKVKGEELKSLHLKLKAMKTTDLRWLAEGEIDLQKGIMCWVRSVAKPKTF